MPNTTSRLALTQPIGTDASSEFRVAITNNAATLDNAVTITEGTLVSQPAAALNGREYYATDTGQFSKDTGTVWQTLLTLGGGLLTPVNTTASSFTAQSGQLIFAFGGSGQTITLPSSPTNGGLIAVFAWNASGANQVVVSGGAKSIFGLGASGTSIALGIAGAHVLLMYNGSQWMIVGGQQDTGWLGLTYGTNVSATAGSYTPGARLVGDQVRLRGVLTVSSGNPNPWATLPAGVRPASTVETGTSGNTSFLVVNTSGTITCATTGIVFLPLDSTVFPIS